MKAERSEAYFDAAKMYAASCSFEPIFSLFPKAIHTGRRRRREKKKEEEGISKAGHGSYDVSYSLKGPGRVLYKKKKKEEKDCRQS